MELSSHLFTYYSYQFDVCIKISKFQLILATLEAETKLSVSALCHHGRGPGPLGKSHEHFGLLYFICKGGSYIYSGGLLRIRKLSIYAYYVCHSGLTVDTVVTTVDSIFQQFFLEYLCCACYVHACDVLMSRLRDSLPLLELTVWTARQVLDKQYT